MDPAPAATELFYPQTLAEFADLQQVVFQLEVELVAVARAQGFSWAEIGGTLGVSRQAAHHRYAAAIKR